MHKAIIILLVAATCLIGVCMADPQPVDGGWQRSDEVPVETPTAAPLDAEPGVTPAAEPTAGDAVVDAQAAATTAAVPQAYLMWAVFICMGLAMIWVAVKLMGCGGAKR